MVRAEGVREGRRLLVEAELHATGRDRVQFNGQPLRRSRDLLGAFCVTVFTPDDLDLVKGGPQGRRQYLDDLLVALQPRHDVTISEVERVLKQRNALLKSAGGLSGGAGRSLPADVGHTLDVWDVKLSQLGEALVAAREALTARSGAAGQRPPTDAWPKRWRTGTGPPPAWPTSGAGRAICTRLSVGLAATTCGGG